MTAELLVTLEKRTVWKSEKGQFLEFAEHTGHFWCWGCSKFVIGRKYKIAVVEQQMGGSQANLRITEMVEGGERQVKFDSEGIREDSAIAQAQRSTGAVLKTPVVPAPEKNNEFLMHECVAKQAEKIVELINVVAKLMLRQDQAEKIAREQEQKLRILQDKVGVSFV